MLFSEKKSMLLSRIILNKEFSTILITIKKTKEIILQKMQNKVRSSDSGKALSPKFSDKHRCFVSGFCKTYMFVKGSFIVISN